MSRAALLLLILAACRDVQVTTHTYDARSRRGELDVHRRGDADRAPAVLLVHGGSWERGERTQLAAVADRLAGAGYVAATIDYRLVPDGEFPGALHDVFCALAYLRANADALGIDPARVAALGYSAGAHLVGLAAVAADVEGLQDEGCPSGRTNPPAAVISAAGPMDLTRLQGDVTEAFVGLPYGDDPEVWELASPVTHVDAGEPPFLFVHAEHDLVVPVDQSEQMRRVLREAGNDARLLRLEGGGHALGDGAGLGQEQLEFPYDTPEAWLVLIDFLADTVGVP